MARRTNLALVIVAVSGLFALCEPMWSSERVEGLIVQGNFVKLLMSYGENYVC